MWKDKEDHPSPFPVQSTNNKARGRPFAPPITTTTSLNGIYVGSIIQRSLFS